MGEVYRATDTNLKRQVAIKVLPASVAADGDRLARFQREAEVLAALNHPNIAHIFGGTNLYTKDRQEIVKIGITTGSVEGRVHQLYTTGVPFRFRVSRAFETRNYYELEQSAHRLLDPYRINQSREFFTEKCLPYVEQLLQMHKSIQDTA